MSNQGHKGSKCYTNGLKTILIFPGEKIPEGFYPGRHSKHQAWNKGLTKETDDRVLKGELKRYLSRKYDPISEKQKKKISESMLGKNKGKSRITKESTKLKLRFIHSQRSDEYIRAIVKKRRETMRKNKTSNTSKLEDKFYADLCFQFGEENIIRHYSDSRYPFDCDFYIPSLDMFIEINGTWTHGYEPFDPLNEKHIMILEKWKKKDTSYYNNAIYNWTKRDPLKLKTFRDNKLNFKIIYPNDLIIDK